MFSEFSIQRFDTVLKEWQDFANYPFLRASEMEKTFKQVETHYTFLVERMDWITKFRIVYRDWKESVLLEQHVIDLSEGE